MQIALVMKRFETMQCKGFSLVEVVVAVGIFALAIVGVIGLLSPTNKAIVDVTDSDAASRVISSIQSGLQQTGFTTVKNNLIPANTTLTASSYKFYASKSGDKIDLVSNLSSVTDKSKAFFEFALIRNDSLSPSSADASAGFLAFSISLRWPAYLPNGVQFTTGTEKGVLIVPAAVTR